MKFIDNLYNCFINFKAMTGTGKQNQCICSESGRVKARLYNLFPDHPGVPD